MADPVSSLARRQRGPSGSVRPLPSGGPALSVGPPKGQRDLLYIRPRKLFSGEEQLAGGRALLTSLPHSRVKRSFRGGLQAVYDDRRDHGLLRSSRTHNEASVHECVFSSRSEDCGTEPATPHGATLQHAGKTAHRRRAKTRARVRACVFPASGRRATTLLSSSAEPRPKIVCAEKRFRQMKTAPPRTKPARDTFEAPRNAFVPALGGESPGEGRWGGRKDSRARRIRPPIPSRARLSLQPLCARDRR
ncbi:hypothetical protein HPB50_019101 [Hyalomma asiaticum]|uniref:Uncharacterized protein n=1 Tax=Hyalomma asiaticum TaxID=266040 RepID=A0ACB7SPI4_HYAAI|nr:hypothetical protein HPB50_019101 [Hyalomma asiaticum]